MKEDGARLLYWSDIKPPIARDFSFSKSTMTIDTSTFANAACSASTVSFPE